MVRQLRELADENYGFFDVKKSIGVNLSALWRVSDNEEQFIDYYSRVLQHEWLHEQVFDILWECWTPKEEDIIERLSSTYSFQEKPVKNLHQVWRVE